MTFLLALFLSASFLESRHSLQPNGKNMLSPLSRVISTHLSATHRVLAFGDSLTAGTSPPDYNLYPYSGFLEAVLNLPKYSTSGPVLVRHKGYPGFTASQLVEYAQLDGGLANIIDKIQNPPLSLVLLLAGTNDLAYETSADKIFQSVANLHRICHDKGVPHTIALGIPPSGYQSQVPSVGDIAQSVNESLESYCLENAGRMTYFPFPFKFQRGDDRWCADGLHFTAKGYEQIAEALAPTVSSVIEKLPKL
jgi:lysophospholipase L1-like esterase